MARDGKALFSAPECQDEGLMHSVKIKPFDLHALKLQAKDETCPVIEVVPGQIITRSRREKMPAKNGFIEADPARDILKLVVVERHNSTGHIGLGLVSGIRLKTGRSGFFHCP